MSIQNFNTAASRNAFRAELTMLKHAQPIIVLGNFGAQKEQPLKKTDTIIFRRANPFAMNTGTTVEGTTRYVGTPVITPNNFLMAEGVTPDSRTISYTDVSVTLQQYGVLFKFSSKAELMHEDDIPQDMAEQTGEALAEVSELIRYGVLKGGTSVLYANGSSRAAVNTPISLAKLRSAVRTLSSNRASMVTSRLAPGPDFNTAPIEPGYIVFCHTDLASDIRNLPGFTKVVEYASYKPAHERELGSVEEFRFITSPLLAPWLAAGSSSTNGMVSQGGSNVDVYPIIVMGKDAWAQVALKGMGAITPRIISSKTTNHANPMGQFGYVGASFWMACLRLNEAWMCRIEVAATTL